MLTYFNKFASCCYFRMAFPLSSSNGMSNIITHTSRSGKADVSFFRCFLQERLSIYSFNKSTVFLSSSCIYRVLNYASKHYPSETGVIGTSPTSHMMDLSSEIWPEGPSGCSPTMWINYPSVRERRRSRVERQCRRDAREKHFIFLHQSAGISGLQQIFNHNKSSSQVFKKIHLGVKRDPCQSEPLTQTQQKRKSSPDSNSGQENVGLQ